MANYYVKIEPSEGEIQDTICEYLYRKGYVFWRQNSVGVYDAIKKIHRSLPKYAIAGISDIVLLNEGNAYFIEVKDHKGQQNENQVLFQEFVEKAGCEYYVVRSLEDVMAAGF